MLIRLYQKQRQDNFSVLFHSKGLSNTASEHSNNFTTQMKTFESFFFDVCCYNLANVDDGLFIF